MKKLSVLMCVHNGEEFLKEAVKSVLDQTFSEFEFIIIDDASTDKSPEILSSFSDPRIQVIRNEVNLGLTKSLNKGLTYAKGEFIARMDADDICLPFRFEKQIDFFTKHPDIALCGSHVTLIGSSTGLGCYPEAHEQIKVTAMANSPFAHPAVMWRRKVFDDLQLRYDEGYRTSQDFELWSRAVHKVKAANIAEPLIYYREHIKQITKSKQSNQSLNARKTKLKQLEYLGLTPSESETIAHLCLFDGQFSEYQDATTLRAADEWMYKIVLANKAMGIYDEQLLLNFWKQKLWGGGLFKYDLKIWKVLRTSKSAQNCSISSGDRLKLLVKCLMGWKIKR